jgi:hypothetical protein
LFAGGQDHEIRIWDLAQAFDEKAPKPKLLSGHTGDVRSLALLNNDTLLLSGSDDGTARIWDLKNDHEMADLISMSKHPRWLVVTPEGLFDGPSDSILNVSWRLPGSNDVFPLDAFYNDYFHPGLSAEVFHGGHPMPCEDIAALLRVPGVQLMLQQRMLHVETQEGHAVLCLPLHPDAHLFEGLDARLKGLPITVDSSKFHPGSSSSCSYALDLPGKSEEVEINTRLSPVAVSCRTPNVIPQEKRCLGEADQRPKGSVLHVQTIAISKYPPSSDYGTLKSATADALKLENFFRDKTPAADESYETVTVWPKLYDVDANLADIRVRFRAMAEDIKEDDVVLLYLSGHGIVPPGQEMFYFLPVDGKAGSEMDSALSTAVLADFVRNLNARRIIIFINACQSGGALDSLAKIVAAKGSAVNSFSGAAQDNESAGVYIIAAATPFQEAKSPSGIDPFANALLDALQSSLAKNPHEVCAQDLTSRITEHVSRILSLDQLPVSFSDGENFVIVGRGDNHSSKENQKSLLH